MHVENGASGFFDRKTIECRSFEHADIKSKFLSRKETRSVPPHLIYIFSSAASA